MATSSNPSKLKKKRPSRRRPTTKKVEKAPAVELPRAQEIQVNPIPKIRPTIKRRAPLMKIVAKKWKPKNFKEIGQGGEAIIYLLKPDTVAKVFLLPDTPILCDNKDWKEAAVDRIREMQTKLDAFPDGLPPGVVIPNGLLVDGSGSVFGYTMPFINGVSMCELTKVNSVMTMKERGEVILHLYDLLVGSHDHGFVFGDLTENNIIVSQTTPYMIDADAGQFGTFVSRTFLPRFTDPNILRIEKGHKQKKTIYCECSTCQGLPEKEKNVLRTEMVNIPSTIKMISPHSELTDWYAYLVVVMRLLVFTDPFGGIVGDMNLDERISEKLTVFDSKVAYPANCRPLKDLSRPMLKLFYRFFHLQERFVPEREVLAQIE